MKKPSGVNEFFPIEVMKEARIKADHELFMKAKKEKEGIVGFQEKFARALVYLDMETDLLTWGMLKGVKEVMNRKYMVLHPRTHKVESLRTASSLL